MPFENRTCSEFEPPLYLNYIPFNDEANVHDLNTRPVGYSDPHNVSKFNLPNSIDNNDADPLESCHCDFSVGSRRNDCRPRQKDFVKRCRQCRNGNIAMILHKFGHKTQNESPKKEREMEMRPHNSQTQIL